MDRVQVVLQLAGARRVGLRGLQLPLGERQLRLGALELGAKADQLLLGLTDPGGVVAGSLSLGLRSALDDAPGQLLVLGLQRLRLPFEQAGSLLQLASAVLGAHAPVPRRPARAPRAGELALSACIARSSMLGSVREETCCACR